MLKIQECKKQLSTQNLIGFLRCRIAFVFLLTLFSPYVYLFLGAFVLVYCICYFPNTYLTSRLYTIRKSAIGHTTQIYLHILDSQRACINFEDGCFDVSGSLNTISNIFQTISYKLYY